MEFRFFRCPSCGRKLKADEEAAGMKVDCPDCGMEFLVPQPEVSLPPSVPEHPVNRPETLLLQIQMLTGPFDVPRLLAAI
jgi:DNA-directed RNA polymerase subunit RPC12/RpoP